MNSTPSLSVQTSELRCDITITCEAQLNALSVEVLRDLSGLLIELTETCRSRNGYQDCRVVTLTGQGEKAFVAGADIKVMHKASPEGAQSFIELGQKVMRQLEELPLPVIALVNGFAIGGGLELALSCDLIVAADSAKLGLAETGLGIIPGFGGTQRLVQRCGVGVAKRLIFTADPITASDALALGIVDWVVPGAQLQEKGREIAGSILKRGPLAIAAAKRAILAGVDISKQPGLKSEVAEFLNVIASRDADEGLSAFVEKRKPAFRGR